MNPLWRGSLACPPALQTARGAACANTTATTRKISEIQNVTLHCMKQPDIIIET